MYCPQCTSTMIECESKEESPYSSYSYGGGTASNTSGIPYAGTSAGAPFYVIGTAVGVAGGSNGNYALPKTELYTRYNCSKCGISIKIENDKKSIEKKELLFYAKHLVDLKNQFNDSIKMFNKKWNDSITIGKLESLLMLK